MDFRTGIWCPWELWAVPHRLWGPDRKCSWAQWHLRGIACAGTNCRHASPEIWWSSPINTNTSKIHGTIRAWITKGSNGFFGNPSTWQRVVSLAWITRNILSILKPEHVFKQRESIQQFTINILNDKSRFKRIYFLNLETKLMNENEWRHKNIK